MINFSSKNDGTWCYYNEDDHDQGGVCLRELSTDRYEQIERITVKTKKAFKRGIAYNDVKTDEKLANKLRWDYCIVDWKSTGLDGVELECTKDNKVKMMKVNSFIKFVADEIEKLSEMNIEIEEARLKNSGNTSPLPTEIKKV